MEAIKQDYLRRGLAILFLMLASADIFTDTLSPKPCCEGLDGLAISTAIHTSTFIQANDVTTLTALDGDAQGHSDTGDCSDEYCLFCCAQILVNPEFDVAVLELNRPASDLTACILPTSPPQNFFHPPRIS